MAIRKEKPITDIEGWYTAGNAAAVLSKKSGRNVSTAYVFRLGDMGKIATKKIGERATLYKKADVDAYTVEAPAEKANRARHEQ